ncbi:hypothetical protein KKG71_00470 [Patescibacteria group bacterium]|nr:hypothetical protein [Patescibacteria group bacterium]
MVKEKNNYRESGSCDWKAFLKLPKEQMIKMIRFIFQEGDEKMIEMLTMAMVYYPHPGDVPNTFRECQAARNKESNWKDLKKAPPFSLKEMEEMRDRLKSWGEGQLVFRGGDGCVTSSRCMGAK